MMVNFLEFDNGLGFAWLNTWNCAQLTINGGQWGL